MYSCFGVIRGLHADTGIKNDHPWVQVLNGLVEISQVIIQVALIEHLHQKVLYTVNVIGPTLVLNKDFLSLLHSSFIILLNYAEKT